MEPYSIKKSSLVKNLPANARDKSSTLNQEDPLEKERATHSSILAWRIPWTEDPGGYSPAGHKESDTTERLNRNSNNKFS